jgi:hypothetical protein
MKTLLQRLIRFLGGKQETKKVKHISSGPTSNFPESTPDAANWVLVKPDFKRPRPDVPTSASPGSLTKAEGTRLSSLHSDSKKSTQATPRGRSPIERPKVLVVEHDRQRVGPPYWKLRGWRKVDDCLYLGHFKTRLGRRHGVIKWDSSWNFSIYVHDVPRAILDGPSGACFSEVKPGKFRIHFYQLPSDLNSAIFYIETLLQEGFSNGC